jgi:hypothetical protein
LSEPNSVTAGFELVLPEAAQVVFGEAPVAEEGGEDERENGVAVIVFAVYLLAALGEPALQLPQLGRLLDLGGPFLGFPDDRLQLPPECQVEGPAGTAFSAGDHFISLSGAAWVAELAMLRSSMWHFHVSILSRPMSTLIKKPELSPHESVYRGYFRETVGGKDTDPNISHWPSWPER